MKNTENSQIFQIRQCCSILGVFQGNLRQLEGVFGLSRSVLEASWGVRRRPLKGLIGNATTFCAELR